MIQMKNLLALHIHTHVLLYNWPSTAQDFNLPSKLSKIPIITGQLALHICGPTSTGSANYGTCSSVRAGSHVCLCVPPRTAAHQAPLSQGFSRQEYWSGLPFSSPMHACTRSRFSRVQLCAASWTAAHQAPLSTEFSRQEYWSGLPFPSPVGSSNKR